MTGASLVGTGAELVTVEARCDRRERERTDVVITGLPDPVTRESRGRLASALEANGLHLVAGRLFLNLVPAARRKSGEILDLPLCLAAAAATGHFEGRRLARTLFLGEVGIDGRLHAVPGGFAAARAAAAAGIERVVAPPATAAEAACLPGVAAHGARDLRTVIGHLFDAPLDRVAPPAPPEPSARAGRLDDVRGQAAAKRALAVAAAGGHALCLCGPPGAGKSMLARRLVDLLPPPELTERLEITQVLSATGRWPGGLAASRPFRAPHHTVSHAGLVGGGTPPAPGEITLAHAGVLFLDELPEFRRTTLEALRQPLEDHTILIARAGRRVELPAHFQLVCAMNPCPCGWRGHPRAVCRCPPGHVERYRRRISGPLFDRIDVRVDVQPVAVEDLFGQACDATERPAGRGGPSDNGEPGATALGEAVRRARERAVDRQGDPNAALEGDLLERVAPLDADGRRLLVRAARSRRLSARALTSVRRVARTVADLADEDAVGPAQLAEALALRAPLFEEPAAR